MSDYQGNENAVELDPTLDFIAGTVAGVSGLVVGFPFDTVKYRFQNPAPNVQYRSTFHALTTITREERLRGLFKGISSPLVRPRPSAEYPEVETSWGGWRNPRTTNRPPHQF